MLKNDFDLRRLPAPLKYALALLLVALVVGAALVVGRGRPVPGWLTGRLIPALGWVYLALCVYLIVYYLVRRIRRK